MTGRPLPVAIAVALVVGLPAAASPTWGVPVQISAGDRALGPDLALNAAGDALVAWDQEVGPDCSTSPASLTCIHIVTAAARTRAPATWSTPIEISRPGVGAAPRAAIDPLGNAAISWVHDIGRDRVLQATYRRGPSGAWPEPNDISEPRSAIRNHEIAFDSTGNAIVTWCERDSVDTRFVVRTAVRPNALGVWSSAVTLSGSGPTSYTGAASGPSLAVTKDDHAVVAWVDYLDHVYVRRGAIGTWAWEAPVDVPVPYGDKRDPKVAANSASDMAVVWARGDPNDSRALVEAVLRFGGGAWTQAVDIGWVASRAADDLQVAVDDSGNFLVAWIDVEGRLQTAALLKGDGWKRSVLAAPSAGLSQPRVAIDALGNAVIVWTTTDRGVVQAAISPGASGEWQLLAGTSVSGRGALDPGVAIDASGNAVAVWNQRSSERVVVESADLVAGGPVLSNLRVPRKGRARARLVFSVTAAPWVAPLTSSPRWNFGDGASENGLRVRHRYRRLGSYLVTVRASDARGGVTAVTRRIRVAKRG